MAQYGELQAKYPDLEVWGHPAQYHDLYELTVTGQKTATSYWFAEDGCDYDSLDKPGSRSIMVDNPDCPTQEVLLVTEKVLIEKFSEISEETALANGEGDGSVADWQRIFGDFWKSHLPTVDLVFSADGLVVTEFFRVEEV